MERSNHLTRGRNRPTEGGMRTANGSDQKENNLKNVDNRRLI